MRDRQDIQLFAYDQAFKEFSDLWDAWKLLETKAQATLATVGIFAAGAFAFLTQAKPTDPLARHFLFGMMVFLGISLALSIWSIQIRSATTPFTKGVPDDILAHLSDTTMTLEQKHEFWLSKVTTSCSASNEKLRKTLEGKATILSCSLWTLLVAAGGAVVLVWLTLYVEQPSKVQDEKICSSSSNYILNFCPILRENL